jgi:hypothetical protein
MNEEQKKEWKRYNKELHLLLEPLCKELTNLEISENKIVWLAIASKFIKGFINRVRAGEYN